MPDRVSNRRQNRSSVRIFMLQPIDPDDYARFIRSPAVELKSRMQ
jgi:hypothetical protein